MSHSSQHCDKIPEQSNIWKERLMLPFATKRCDSSVRQLVTWCLQWGSREKWMLVLSLLFPSFFFFKSGTPALMVLATFHVHCPLVGLFCKHLMDTHCFHGWSGWWWRITQSTKVAALLGQDLLTVGGQGQGNTSTDLRSDQQMTINRPVWKLSGSQ